MSMSAKKPVVVIGPISDDPAESVSGVNKALMAGLREVYTFVPSETNRRFGGTAQARFNAWNLYYLAKHTLIWIWNLIWRRPQIAHYAINGGWALWKGLLFLRIARIMGIKTVGHLHSGGFLDYWKTLPEKKRASALAQFELLDAFVVLSESWRTRIATEVGVSAAKLHVVNNPIDGRFEDAALQMPLEREQNAFLAMGIMSRDKGAPDLVNSCGAAIKNAPSLKLHLAGPEREPGIFDRIRQLIAEHHLEGKIDLPGMVRGDAKIQLFRDTAISVLPSYYENFPLVLLEAAAAGHAIITTPVGAVPEFFSDGSSAVFVEPGNIAQLSAAMTRLANDREERLRLARGARAVFTGSLSRAAIMNSLDQVYRSILTPGGKELQLATSDASTSA